MKYTRTFAYVPLHFLFDDLFFLLVFFFFFCLEEADSESDESSEEDDEEDEDESEDDDESEEEEEESELEEELDESFRFFLASDSVDLSSTWVVFFWASCMVLFNFCVLESLCTYFRCPLHSYVQWPICRHF